MSGDPLNGPPIYPKSTKTRSGGGDGESGQSNGSKPVATLALTAVVAAVAGGLVTGQFLTRAEVQEQTKVHERLARVEAQLEGVDRRLEKIERDMVTENDLRALVIQLNRD